MKFYSKKIEEAVRKCGPNLAKRSISLNQVTDDINNLEHFLKENNPAILFDYEAWDLEGPNGYRLFYKLEWSKGTHGYRLHLERNEGGNRIKKPLIEWDAETKIIAHKHLPEFLEEFNECLTLLRKDLTWDTK